MRPSSVAAGEPGPALRRRLLLRAAKPLVLLGLSAVAIALVGPHGFRHHHDLGHRILSHAHAHAGPHRHAFGDHDHPHEPLAHEASGATHLPVAPGERDEPTERYLPGSGPALSEPAEPNLESAPLLAAEPVLPEWQVRKITLPRGSGVSPRAPPRSIG
jgi:hypothetical protein